MRDLKANFRSWWNRYTAARSIRQREEKSGGHTSIIAMTANAMREDRARCLDAGMDGFIPKPIALEELETAIRTVHAGSRHIPAAIAERLAERMASSDLTSREMEVLELIVRGQSNKEIGASLTISEATVKSHINNILSKLGVTDRTQAVTTALQRGLVHLR